jgi:hypothetical protein
MAECISIFIAHPVVLKVYFMLFPFMIDQTERYGYQVLLHTLSKESSLGLSQVLLTFHASLDVSVVRVKILDSMLSDAFTVVVTFFVGSFGATAHKLDSTCVGFHITTSSQERFIN